ncbi:hypothetical protein [Kaistia nematophila]|uniref:Uncharacterized protein n=1 Tax=Kaistia nematophila TaxID=2994654 RepID=A0A9X3E331_9HYPH|nr:hypothetical protein [Kaistia nematophila]MCX5570188.1 hypothetical protein [Kaistia nematophila]
MTDDKTARRKVPDDRNVPDREDAKQAVPMPPEGPHARPDLTDHEKTPGTGSLPGPATEGVDIGPG